MLPLTSLDPQGLHIFTNDRNVLRDLFAYLDYVRERSIKRMTRTNEIPRGDLQRIAKLLGGLTFDSPHSEIDAARWIDFIDNLAYRLDLVNYDIEGEYRGYSSSEPSFLENYIVLNSARAGKFFQLAPVQQEKEILKTLVDPKLTGNEFYQTSVVGMLDGFNRLGSAVGVMPLIKFPEVRQFLLNQLEACAPGVWYSVESWIAYLKSHHPYFIIPQNIKPDKWGSTTARYDYFYESKDMWSEGKTVPVDAPDGFERVEGRYVERFLEYIPLILRFIDAAYDPAPYQGLYPMRGMLKAFRVNERLLRLMRTENTQPHITIQPNFDVVVESDFYPAKIIQHISALCEPVSSPSSSGAYVGIFQLKKARVAAEQVRQPNLDVIALLKELSGRDLPANVQVELDEWSGHAEQFTLYEGFALLESVDEIPEAEEFSVERITPTLRLVRDPHEMIAALERSVYAPLRVLHLAKDFAPVSDAAISVFPKISAWKEAQQTVRQVKISRFVSIMVKFPDDESFLTFSKMLAELRCPFQSDSKNRALTFDQKNQAKFDEAVQKLSHVLVVEIE